MVTLPKQKRLDKTAHRNLNRYPDPVGKSVVKNELRPTHENRYLAKMDRRLSLP